MYKINNDSLFNVVHSTVCVYQTAFIINHSYLFPPEI